MLIERLQLSLLRLPLLTPRVVADKTFDYLDTVYLRIDSQGQSGWSEAAPGNFPLITAEWSRGVFTFVRESLAPFIMAGNLSINDPKAMTATLAPFKENYYAKGLFDMAWWDLHGRIKQEPLWKLLDGTQSMIEVGLTFDRNENHDLFYKDIARANEEQFRRLTVKFRPGWDLQVVAALRAESAPLTKLIVDPEGVLNPEMQSDLLYRLEDFFITALEQPTSPTDLVAHAMLRETLRTPIALDESIQSVLQAKIALDLQAASYFCMKPGRVGGHTLAKEIQQLAAAGSVDCYGSCELETALGYRHLLALSSLESFRLPCDYLRFEEIFAEQPVESVVTKVIEPEIESADETTGTKSKPKKPFRAVELSDQPGIGCEVDQSIVDKYTIDRVELTRA